jgi:hypothetical protein
MDLLKTTSQENIVLTMKEYHELRDLVEILNPFAEATDFTQGNQATIGCIIPIILSLDKQLKIKIETTKIQKPLILHLQRGLHERFLGIYEQMKITFQTDGGNNSCTTKNLYFSSIAYGMAAALDPRHGFRWLQNHPGSILDKENVKRSITGNKTMD